MVCERGFHQKDYACIVHKGKPYLSEGNNKGVGETANEVVYHRMYRRHGGAMERSVDATWYLMLKNREDIGLGSLLSSTVKAHDLRFRSERLRRKVQIISLVSFIMVALQCLESLQSESYNLSW